MFPLRYWILGIVMIPSVVAADARWFARVWQTDEGLPNNHVRAVLQGPDRSLWLATPKGIARFDGYQFSPVDRRPGGVSGLRMTFPMVRPLVDRHHARWIIDHRGVVVRIENGRRKAFTGAALPAGSSRNLVLSRSGEIWLSKGNAIAVYRQGRFQVVLTRHVPVIAPDSKGGVWFGSDGEVAELAPDGTVGARYELSVGRSRPTFKALLEDHRGALWVGTAVSGLFRLAHGVFSPVGTSYRYILSLTEDDEHNIWVGTDGGGLDRVTDRALRLETFAGGLTPVGIQSVAEAGRLWGITQDRRVVVRSEGRWGIPASRALASIAAPLCVAADHAGTLWIGTASRSLYRWGGGQLARWGAREGLAGRSIHALLPAANGDVWIGEYDPDLVQCLHHGKVETPRFDGALGGVHAIAEDAAGRIWVATGYGLFLARGDELRRQPSPQGRPSASIRCLQPTSDGALWAGFAGIGLGQWKNGRWKMFTAGDGLPDDYISQIVDDHHGWLWLGSASHGIFKVRYNSDGLLKAPGGKIRPIVYGRNEGLFSLEGYGSDSIDAVGASAFRSVDGRLWVPMRTGLAVVQPGALHENTAPPPVQITAVLVDGKPAGRVSTLAPAPRTLEFDFTAINLASPVNVHCRYRLDGLEPDWVDPGSARSVTYTRLAPGSYRFELEACNYDGPWRQARPIAFTIAPPIWETLWFRVGTLVVSALALAGVLRLLSMRRIRAINRQLREHAALESERSRIARDLHDDLGGSLTQAALSLQLALRTDGTAPRERIARCVELVRHAAGSVDEIIWAINPRNDTLPRLIDYISQHVVEFLHAAGIECTVELPDIIPDRQVSPDVRHHLFLVVKESLNNIIRHAGATEVRFEVVINGDRVGVLLEDNGRGFDAPPARDANADGLENMRHRMAEIGGEFSIRSIAGQGTRVMVDYPCPW